MGTSSRILVVEDDPALSGLLRQQLEGDGFLVLMAETGEQAMQLAAKEKPSVILLDIMLPDIDGVTVLTQLAKSPTTSTIPVIVLTNLEEDGSRDQVAAIGKYEYIIKSSVQLDEIVARVKAKLK